MKLQETHARGTIFVGAASIWKAFPANLKPPAPSCVNEPSKLNPCQTVCYVHVITKEQGKGKWALPKNLRRLLTTIWQRKAVWKTSFQTNPQELSALCIYPETPEQHKECVNQQNTVYHKFCPIFLSCNLWGASHSNSTLSNRVLLAFIYQKDTAKEQGHGRMTYKVFSLNPFYYFGEDNWNIVFKQILRNEHACNLLPKKCWTLPRT